MLVLIFAFVVVINVGSWKHRLMSEPWNLLLFCPNNDNDNESSGIVGKERKGWCLALNNNKNLPKAGPSLRTAAAIPTDNDAVIMNTETSTAAQQVRATEEIQTTATSDMVVPDKASTVRSFEEAAQEQAFELRNGRNLKNAEQNVEHNTQTDLQKGPTTVPTPTPTTERPVVTFLPTKPDPATPDDELDSYPTKSPISTVPSRMPVPPRPTHNPSVPGFWEDWTQRDEAWKDYLADVDEQYDFYYMDVWGGELYMHISAYCGGGGMEVAIERSLDHIPPGTYDIQVKLRHVSGRSGYCAGTEQVGNYINVNGQDVTFVQKEACTDYVYVETMLFAYDVSFKGDGTDTLRLGARIEECLYQDVWWGPLAVESRLPRYTLAPMPPPMMFDFLEDWSDPNSLQDWSLFSILMTEIRTRNHGSKRGNYS